MRVQLECEMKCVVVGELSVKHGLEWNWWDTTEITKMSDLLFLWEYSCVIAQRASLQTLMCAEFLNRIKGVAISWAYLILPQQVTCSHSQWWQFSLSKMFWHCLLELEGWGVAKAQQPFHLPTSWERNVTEIQNWRSRRICPAWWQEGKRGARRHFYNSGPSPLIRSQAQIVSGCSHGQYFTPTCTCHF